MPIVKGIAKLVSEKAPQYLLAAIIGMLGFLLTLLISEVKAPLLFAAFADISTKTLGTATAIFFLIALIEIAYIFHLHREKQNKLIPKFGALWDKSKAPFCTACQKPAGFNTNYALYCFSCKTRIMLVDDDGKELNLKTAKERIELE